MSDETVSTDEINRFYEKLNREAESGGYHLNPDESWTLGLIEGILTNEDRYGYGSCPCRLATGFKERDEDILCPCRYKDDDIREFGSCYCALYVSREWNAGTIPRMPVPERRPPKR